jgi:hypothetical protein
VSSTVFTRENGNLPKGCGCLILVLLPLCFLLSLQIGVGSKNLASPDKANTPDSNVQRGSAETGNDKNAGGMR